MKYVQLGKTGLNISRVGFGGIPIQRITPEEARTLMQAVTAAGINYIDTAKAYTVSESYIGQAIAGMRDKFVLATKSMARTKEAMAADIQDSLNRLQTDYIDLYQVHNPNMEQLRTVCAPGGALEALLEAKAAGKIRHIGLTAHSAAVFEISPTCSTRTATRKAESFPNSAPLLYPQRPEHRRLEFVRNLPAAHTA
jgi:aryl-alcohol dehydrogenase-like predicted oxidoreductase